MPPISRLVVEEAELPACEREHDGVGRCLIHEIGVVAAARLGAIASTHEEEVADVAVLHGLDHRGRHREDRVATEAHHHAATVNLFDEAGQLKRAVDHDLEIAVLHVHGTRVCHPPRREDVLGIALTRVLDAVGGHEDGAGELIEFPALVLPCGAVVSVEVLILLELRITVRRQHLAVGVDVDAETFGLLKQLLEVCEVVARDRDRLVGPVSERDLGGHRMPVCARVGRVEQLHDAQVHLAGPEREADPVLEPEVAVGESREQLVLERIDRRIRVAEHTGVVGVRGDTLEAVYGGLLEGLDVLVAAMVGEDPDSLTLRHELLDCGGRLERDSRVDRRHDATRCFYLGRAAQSSPPRHVG